jgi:hypothetical protein
VAATEHALDPVRSDVVADVRLMDGASQVTLLEDGGEVDEGSLDGGDRDATPRRGVCGAPAARAAGDDAADASVPCTENFRQ